jgi:hypothetical protein
MMVGRNIIITEGRLIIQCMELGLIRCNYITSKVLFRIQYSY